VVWGRREDSMINRHRHTKYIATFEERLAQEALELKQAAEKQPNGSPARQLLLRRARQAETGSNIDKWLSSRGLRPPQAFKSLFAK
jgi:hypothetical protein